VRYPIGQFAWQGSSTPAERSRWIQTIAETPRNLRASVDGLTDRQLDTPYREGGWTVRQVVHHYADDHMNSYVRFKLALTEDAPAIKGYSESAWAEVADARSGPIAPSLDLLTALHERWVLAWNSLSDHDWARTFVHPVRGPVSLEHLAALYAWHGLHHVAQIASVRK
jgi:hypothetical protein